jgi:hypothetical protein
MRVHSTGPDGEEGFDGFMEQDFFVQVLTVGYADFN